MTSACFCLHPRATTMGGNLFRAGVVVAIRRLLRPLCLRRTMKRAGLFTRGEKRPVSRPLPRFPPASPIGGIPQREIYDYGFRIGLINTSLCAGQMQYEGKKTSCATYVAILRCSAMRASKRYAHSRCGAGRESIKDVKTTNSSSLRCVRSGISAMFSRGDRG